MNLFLLDTDMLSLVEQGHPTALQNVNNHSKSDVAVCAITIQEQMTGFQAALARARTRQQIARCYEMLVTRLLPAWTRFSVLPFTESDILRFEHLRGLRLNVGMMDLRIAAIALENGLSVVTRNLRDFSRVPGLRTEDWSI